MSRNELKILVDDILTKVKSKCYDKIDNGSMITVNKLINDTFVELLLDKHEQKKPSNLIGTVVKDRACFEFQDGEFFPLYEVENEQDED